MKKLFPRLLCLLLVLTMLPISAMAGLDNHNNYDVTIVKSNDDGNYYFPDIIKLNDGKLLACFYKAVTHVAEDSFGAIYLAESTDHGHTWSEPWKVIDRSADYKDSRDPNLAILPDGTVVLTYFGAGDCCILFSKDGGHSWSKEIKVVSDILDLSVAKRGTIAVIDNDNMLVPFYGKSSGENAYGAPATATGTNVFGNKWQVDAVIMHYQKQEGGNWEVVYESMLGQSIDETGVLFTGKGGDVTIGEDGYPVYSGDVWAFSREDGSVRVSHDNCRTWQLMAKEEPRMYTNEGTILWGEQVIQPRFVKISDDCWFATYANYNNLNYAHDRVSRPVYGKVFFPEEGWYAHQARLIFDGTGHGVSDMADPAAVVTDEGKILIIYYSTTTQGIHGTFTDLEDWVTENDTNVEEKTIEREFWNGAMSSQQAADSIFDIRNTTKWTWVEPGMILSGDLLKDGMPGLTSKETISTDYSVEFDFQLRGTSRDLDNGRKYDERDEGIQVYPIYNTTNPNAEVNDKGALLQYRIKMSPSHGVTLCYDASTNGDYGTVIAGKKGDAVVRDFEHSLPETLKTETMYTAKIKKVGDGLFIKVFEKLAGDTGDWQLEYHDEKIGSNEENYAHQFKLAFSNKNAAEDPLDNESVYIANLKFNELEAISWDFDGMYTKETYQANCTDRRGFVGAEHAGGTTLASADWFEEYNGVKVWSTSKGNSYMNTQEIPSDYTFKTNFTFHEETVTDYVDENGKPVKKEEDGLTIFPQYTGAGVQNYRICLSTDRGLQVALGSASYGPYSTLEKTTAAPDVTYVMNNDMTSFEVGKTYTLEYVKSGATLKIRVWPADGTQPTDWDYEIKDATIVGSPKPYTYRMYFYDYDRTTSNESMTLDGLDFSGTYDKETAFWDPFWGNLTDAQEHTEAYFNTENRYFAWQGGAYQSRVGNDTFPEMRARGMLSGDYTAQFDITLNGVSTDTASSHADRDEGLYICPIAPQENSVMGGILQYRIRLSQQYGVQLTYNKNFSGDSGVLAGSLYRDFCKHENGKYVESTLPSTIPSGQPYTIKYAKKGDTLSIKAWPKGTQEPNEWQCVYTDDTINVNGSYYFNMFFRNKGADDETFAISDSRFSKSITVTPVGGITPKKNDSWTFATLDNGTITGINEWQKSDDGTYTNNSQRGYMTTKTTISGHYNAEFKFTLNGNTITEDDGLWIYPLDETSNTYARGGSHMIRLGTDGKIRAYFRTMFGTERQLVMEEDLALIAGIPYNIKVAKNYDTLQVKVWEDGAPEPMGWDLTWMASTIGSKVFYERGKYNYPYDFSRYGDVHSEGNPFRWFFRLETINTERSLPAWAAAGKYWGRTWC